MKSYINLPLVFDYLDYYSSKVETLSPTDVLLQIEEEMNRFVFENVDRQGLPVVIKNLHHHPLWSRTDKGSSFPIFSFEFLDRFYGNKGIHAQKINFHRDLPT